MKNELFKRCLKDIDELETLDDVMTASFILATKAQACFINDPCEGI